MKRSIALRAQLDALRAELLNLDAVEEPTDEQADRARAALGEFTTIEGQHREALAHEAEMDRIRSMAINDPGTRDQGIGSPEFMRRTDPFADLDRVRAGLVGARDLSSRAMAAIEQSIESSDAHRERAAELARDPMIARHILMTGSPEYKDDFAEFMRSPVGFRGTAMTHTDAQGGYLIPWTFDPTLIITNDGSDNPFRQLATIKTTATESWNGVTSAGVTAEWLAEATEAAEAGPTIGALSITPLKAFAEITASWEILQDTNFGSQLPGLLSDAKDRLEEAAFATGNGTTAPKGVVTAVTAVTASRVTPTTGGVFTSASIADIYKLVNALPSRHRRQSSWLANFQTWNIVRQMDSSGGSSFWANFAGPLLPERLLGLPIEISSTMTATVTTGSNLILLGNMKNYVIVDRVGMSLSYDSNVRGANQRHTGQGQYTAWWRVGADVDNAAAFRILKL